MCVCVVSKLNLPSDYYIHYVDMTLYTVSHTESMGWLNWMTALKLLHTHTLTYRDRHKETHALIDGNTHTHTHTHTHTSPSAQFLSRLLRTLSAAPENELVTHVCICTQTLPETNTTGIQGHTCMCMCTHTHTHNTHVHNYTHTHTETCQDV